MSDVRILNAGTGSVSPADLVLAPFNPRRGDVPAIVESFRHIGFYGRVVVDRKTNTVLAGNHRVAAALELGMSEIPVEYVDVDSDAHARAITAADNRTADLAYYDTEALEALIRELNDADMLAGTGYDPGVLDQLARENDPAFEPTLNPTLSTREYTDDDVDAAQQAADSQFERDQTFREVTCPECGHHFEIADS